MKKFLIAASAAMFALSSQAHGDDHHAESSPTSGAKVAAGHDHEHGHGDAIGVAGRADKVTRTVTVEMTDSMRFTPASFTAKQGETIRFKVKNSGQLKHEFVLGTEKELKEHYELMKKFPEMEHSDPNMAHVKPGATGQVVWQFNQAGDFQFACLQPGHFEAGMVGKVTVK